VASSPRAGIADVDRQSQCRRVIAERPQGAWQSSTYTIKRLNSAVLFFLDGHAKPALCVAIQLSDPCNIKLTDLQISTEAMPLELLSMTFFLIHSPYP